jgi:hypothetical protein
MIDQPTTPGTPAGWHPDPLDRSQYRWWDGAQWTGATYPADAVPERSLGRMIGTVVFCAFAALSALAFLSQFSDVGQQSGRSFNIFPALFTLGWSWAAYRCWNPKR